MAEDMLDVPPSDPGIAEVPEQQTAATSPPPQMSKAIPGMPAAHAAERINLLDPSGDLVSVHPDEINTALENGYSQPSSDDIHKYAQEQKYGTPGQIAITAGEGLLKGALGPVGSGLERALGVKAENIRGREETNPGTHLASELTGFGGSALLGLGEAGLLAKAGEAVGAATGLAKGARIAQIGEDAVKAAFEGALYQGGEELHKAFVQDPTQSAETAISDIGMATVLTGMFGGAVGAALRKGSAPLAEEAGHFVSGADMTALEGGDVRASIAASDQIAPKEKESILNAFDLSKKKANAGTIETAAKELGAPVLPGMLSDDKLVHRGVDALLNTPTTFSGRRVASNYAKGFEAANTALEGAIQTGEVGSKAEIGNALKESLTSQIRDEYAPIKQVYQELEETHKIIPIERDAVADMSKALRDIDEARVSKSSPTGKLVNAVVTDLKNVKTVSDLKILKDTHLSLAPTASPGEKRIVSILRDKLDEIADSAVESFAKKMPVGDEARDYTLNLINQKKEITPVYKKFIGKVNELSEQLGKGKIHGTADALQFLNERLTPEEVATKLFSKKDSEFLNFFSKNFPDQFSTVRDFQRAAMRDSAMLKEQFSPKTFFNKFNKLEPEIQRSLYSPKEIVKIRSAETYMRAFPESFNPSGTSHTIAFRDAFSSPAGWAIANARDYGIEQAINIAEKSAQGKQAVELANATISGEKTAAKSIKAIFNKTDLPTNIIPLISQRLKMDKLVTQYAADPAKMLAMNDNNNSVPAYSTAMAASAARVVNYLSNLKPQTAPVNPLDGKRQPSPTEQSKYNRALDIAQQPMVVLSHLKDSRLTPDDINALKTMYPSLYNNLTQKLTAGVVEAMQKDKPIPYGVRQGLSLFLGQPMDSTLTPQSILRAQQASANAKAPYSGEQQQNAPAKSTNKLDKLAPAAMTPSQARESSRASGNHR